MLFLQATTLSSARLGNDRVRDSWSKKGSECRTIAMRRLLDQMVGIAKTKDSLIVRHLRSTTWRFFITCRYYIRNESLICLRSTFICLLISWVQHAYLNWRLVITGFISFNGAANTNVTLEQLICNWSSCLYWTSKWPVITYYLQFAYSSLRKLHEI